MAQDQGTREGYLLLSDISGYTAFLADTELEHANAIVHELTGLIREQLAPPMRFVKLEGDAVFCYAEAASFENGERMIELIENCYFRFRNRLQDMERETTCRCAACASIASLDLKFVVHYGAFVVESDERGEDLAGPDVILVHRLLKNTVCADGGPDAYALLTEPSLRRMPEGLDLAPHTETNDSFGETKGGVHDLGPVLARMREARHAYVGSDDADIEISGEHSYPPPLLWQYFVDPEKRLRWQPMQTAIDNTPNEAGRTGVGASSHCAHGTGGDVLREYLDWRPYGYFTNRLTPLSGGPIFFPGMETIEFTPTDRGTRVDYRFRLGDCGRFARLRFKAVAPGMRRVLGRSRKALDRVLEEDTGAKL